MSPASLMHTLFYFLLALATLIAFHEFGHFIVARKLGVKVIRFSIGFGKPLWRSQKNPDSTEFVVCALPLGGYVKMVDEREGEVEERDLPFAFNRQRLAIRAAIVAAGPVFNLLLAIAIYWIVFIAGETGTRPVLGPVEAGSLAASAGFREGDEILAIDGRATPTWTLAFSSMIEKIMDAGEVSIDVKDVDERQVSRSLKVPAELVDNPKALHEKLGIQPWQPSLDPVIERIEPGSAAELTGLKKGDRLLTADGQAIPNWKFWVEYVRARPDTAIELKFLRDDVSMTGTIRPASIEAGGQKTGRIGATVHIPEEIEAAMQVEYRLGPVDALGAAIEKTYDYSLMTVKMIGRMLIGNAPVDNLSGPISIAQYAGESARLGWAQFLKFLAVVSISLAVLNLLPIPMLDGGHLAFYLFEGVQGRPLSDRTQMALQHIGILLLLALMALAFFLDIERLMS